MPDFAYKAIEPGGALIEGQLSAPGRAQALREIEARGLRPIRIEDRAAGAVRQAASDRTTAVRLIGRASRKRARRQGGQEEPGQLLPGVPG